MTPAINSVDGSDVRKETFKGRDFLVAPVVPIKATNLDKGYVPTREVQKSAPAWNGTPLTLNHPRNSTGDLVSANSPEVAEKTWLGHLFNNTSVNGGEKTRGEAWFDIEHARNLGGQAEKILNKIEAGEEVSVSTSYMFDRLPSGEYDGEYRQQVSGNLRPDHLAILPNKEGKCSIDQGCMVGQQAANQELEEVDVDLEPPRAVVNAAEEALAAKDEYDELSTCGTGRGEQRARQIVEGDLEPADFVTQENGQPIPAYLESHEEDVNGINVTPTQWNEETWTDGCGPVQYALWGGTATGTGLNWARRVRDEIESQLSSNLFAATGITDDPDNSDGSVMGEDFAEEITVPATNALSQARRPEYDGTETTSWSDVDKTLGTFVSAVDTDDEIETVDDMTESQRQTIAEHTLLGDPDAETFDELLVFPVVNPDTGDLNEGALEAVISGRGQSADIPDDVYASADSVARQLLEEEFDRDGLTENSVWKNAVNMFNGLLGAARGEQTENESAESEAETETDNMSERTKELVNEHGFNEDNLPDEDTECFDRIYESFNQEDDDGGQSVNESDEDEQNDEVLDAINSLKEDVEQLQESAVTEDEFEEKLSQNQQQNQKEDLVNEITANSDEYSEEALMDSPLNVVEGIHDEVTSPDTAANYAAMRGASPNAGSSDDSSMPALSANERLSEKEGGD